VDESIISDILTTEDTKSGMESGIAMLRIGLYIMAAVAAVVGLIVVYIVSVMLIEENRKNISMLKVMGYKDSEVSRLLLTSSSLLVWLGFFISIPITLKLINVFYDVLTSNMFFDFETKLIWWQGLISFALIIGVYYFTLWIAKRKVLNINMAESLKAKE